MIFGWGEAFWLSPRELQVYADWVTWAGVAVIAYCVFILAVVNMRAHLRRERKARPTPTSHGRR